MASTFSDLGVAPALLNALEVQKIAQPTPIQIAAVPPLREGKDVYLHAETGTGKTLAYLLPLFSTIDVSLPNCQVVILSPTHELAIQIQRQCNALAQHSGIPVRTIVLVGGVSQARQVENLKKKPHIVVGTLGRIREMIDARKLKTHLVSAIVFDEADRLLTSEGLGHVQAIVKSTPKQRRMIFVSATYDGGTAKAVASLAPSTALIKTAFTAVNADIEHWYILCESRERAEMSRKLIHAMQPSRSIIFVHRNEDAEVLAKKLTHHKLEVIDIHGQLHKDDRKKAMDQVRGGQAGILIASDLAARGIDIPGVSLVINYDTPSTSQAYLHRVGRTGRAGARGHAISLLNEQQLYLVERFESDLGIKLERITLRNGEVLKA